MMDWEDSSGSSSDEDAGDIWNVSKAVNNMKETALSTTRGSMRGLQIAIQEGWLIQRGRDMCSFAHDRYRQASHAEAENLPEGAVSKMSFRVRSRNPTTSSEIDTVILDHPHDATRRNTGCVSYRRPREEVCLLPLSLLQY